VKSSRAQTSDDSETWIPGEVNPTLNSFDVGDTRATTAIIEVDPIGTLQARQHKGANHEGARDGHLIVEEPVLFENSYRDGARIAHDGVSQTLTSKMGTGGGNTPMLAFDTQFGSNANVTEDVAPTLKSSQQAPSVAYSIREDAKANTFSATELDHANSLSALRPSPQSHHAQMFIAETYPIDTRNALRDPEKYDAQNRQGFGIGADGDPMATLTSAHVNAVAQDAETIMSPTLTAYNMDSRSPQSEEQQRIVNAVFESTMAVRRLTPLECERLMGWPDNHTLTKADGTIQADTHRYKQCGNGVASPVAQWIAKHLLNI
jgi:DNA (cytosine-5)-methyltransferase 1